METIGKRIARLRTAKGWKRPELGRQMAQVIDRATPFSGEVIRLYEEDINEPGADARRALALVFDRSEMYIEFGATETGSSTASTTARQPAATYNVSEAALEVARGYDQLSPQCQEHVRRQIELLRGADDSSGRRRAVQQDVWIKRETIRSGARSKKQKRVR